MPQLSQIARSTVLRMQICFAWKSIWSCSKESRTALLLSVPSPAHTGLPLAVYLLSRGKCFHQLHTHGHAVSGIALPQTALSTIGQYADHLTGPHWRPCPQAGQGALQVFAQLDDTRNTGTQGE